jgi:hypothetical protein
MNVSSVLETSVPAVWQYWLDYELLKASIKLYIVDYVLFEREDEYVNNIVCLLERIQNDLVVDPFKALPQNIFKGTEGN